MKLPLVLALTLAAAGPASAQAPDTGARDIRALATRFQQAIKHRDKAMFLSLFLQPTATTWQEVLSNEAVAKDRTSKGKAAYDPDNNPIAFIDSIVSRKQDCAEDFRNIRITHDRDSAAMSFDYSFRMDGVEVNAGMEHWLLVNTVRDGASFPWLGRSDNMCRPHCRSAVSPALVAPIPDRIVRDFLTMFCHLR